MKDAADQLRNPFALAAGSRLDLVFLGKILPLDATLQACGIKTGDTIFLVEVNFSLAAPEPETLSTGRKRTFFLYICWCTGCPFAHSWNMGTRFSAYFCQIFRSQFVRDQ